MAASNTPMSPVTGRRPSPASAAWKSAKDLGIGLGRIAAVEELEAGLEVFAAGPSPRLLPAEDRPEIGVARGLGPVGHVRLHDRHGEVGPQHHLAPVGVAVV
jgi:hypothetical protein